MSSPHRRHCWVGWQTWIGRWHPSVKLLYLQKHWTDCD